MLDQPFGFATSQIPRPFAERTSSGAADEQGLYGGSRPEVGYQIKYANLLLRKPLAEIMLNRRVFGLPELVESTRA